MPRVTAKFTFETPFDINVVDGRIGDTLTLEMPDGTGKVTVRPLVQKEFSSRWERPSETVWESNTVEIDVEMDATAFPPPDEQRFEDAACKYLLRFLRCCRHRSEQFQIDPRWEPDSYNVVFINHDTGETQAGGLSGTMRMQSNPPSLDESHWDKIGDDLRGDPNFDIWEELLLDARLYRSQNNYRMAVLNAAVVIEAIMTRYMKHKLMNREIASKSQIEKFVNEVSNRDLAVVGLGLVSKIAESVREDCRKTLDLRNSILHVPKKNVTGGEASLALKAVEALLSESDIKQWLEEC